MVTNRFIPLVQLIGKVGTTPRPPARSSRRSVPMQAG